MQAFITRGCFTDHGGKILEGEEIWLVDGKAIHLEGMTHYCPRCKVLSKAIATERGFIQVNGRNPIVAGDVSTCGSRYIKISDLAVRSSNSGKDTFVNVVPLLTDYVNGQFFSDQFMLVDQKTGNVLSGIPYLIHRENGEMEEGVTDENGYTKNISNSERAENITIEINDFDLERFFNENFK
ncbi:PAAR domain-containing protein [Acinetobacter gyllenbergii]|uniref:PAAR domain-containing protein n=1 Tax=Acinetobacter gyllenbergii TaxID=134534 RepID=UPI0021D07D2A|nr:PAAR domain-containing protein [Acinetobacter gyllenbergii]MCU4580157.1 PAAR domain-containing protein [Acinetobacter gyllenbergii]